MGRGKGLTALEQCYVNPLGWSDKLSYVFRPQIEANSDALESLEHYLHIRGAQTMRYRGGGNLVQVLCATVSSREETRQQIRREAERGKLTIDERAPMEDKDCSITNIRKRTYQSLIRTDKLDSPYRFYVVSEEDTIFYVGKSKNPISRLCTRLNPLMKRQDDKLGRFTRRYVDDAFTSWRFQLLTLKDCETLFVESRLLPGYDVEPIRAEVIEKYYSDTSWAMRQVEKVLIWLYQPCLNDKHNPFPTPLPIKYHDFPG